MTQHYKGKQRQQARVIHQPSLIVASFADGRKGYMDASTPTEELEQQIAYCSANGANLFYSATFEEICKSPEEILFVKSMMAFDDCADYLKPLIEYCPSCGNRLDSCPCRSVAQ